LSIALVDFGLGNLRSIHRKLEMRGLQVRTVTTPADVRHAGTIILPGVGNFGHAMRRLDESGLSDELRERARAGVSIIGICLGMQLLAEGSEEGIGPGLGLIRGNVVRFDASQGYERRVPHISWAALDWRSDLWAGSQLDWAYFSHSFHVVCSDERDVVATAHHGRDFVAVVRHENVVGVQFHPEKSHDAGISLLRALVDTARS